MLGINFLICPRMLATKYIVWKLVSAALSKHLVFLQSFTCLFEFYPWIIFTLFQFSQHFRFSMSFFNFHFGSFILLVITIYDLGVLISNLANGGGLSNKHVLACNQVDKELSLFFSDYIVFFGSVCDEWLVSYLINWFKKLLKLMLNIHTIIFKITFLELGSILIFFGLILIMALVHHYLKLLS